MNKARTGAGDRSDGATIALLELDRFGLGVDALLAFEGAQVLVDLLSRFDLSQEHREPALRASPLTNRRFQRCDATRKWHSDYPG